MPAGALYLWLYLLCGLFMAFVVGVAAFLVWRGRKTQRPLVTRSLPVRPVDPVSEDEAGEAHAGASAATTGAEQGNADGQSTPS